MGIMKQKLHFKYPSGVHEMCDIYTTKVEVGGHHLKLNINGAIGYVRLGFPDDFYATKCRVKLDNVEYAVCTQKSGFVYHHNAFSLDGARNGKGTGVGQYGLIVGDGIDEAKGVRAVNISFTVTTPTALSAARERLAAATTPSGKYALFAGGKNPSTSVSMTTVNAYTATLTRSTPTALSKSRYDLVPATVGVYTLFAGGQYETSSTVEYVTTVNAYNASLSRSTPTALPSADDSDSLGGLSVDGLAIFVRCDSYANFVQMYNTSLTASQPGGYIPTLSGGKCIATNVAGKYGIITNGQSLIVYNSSGTSSVGPTLPFTGKRPSYSLGPYGAISGKDKTAFIDTNLTFRIVNGILLDAVANVGLAAISAGSPSGGRAITIY